MLRNSIRITSRNIKRFAINAMTITDQSLFVTPMAKKIEKLNTTTVVGGKKMVKRGLKKDFTIFYGQSW